MFTKLLVPLDRSSLGEQALGRAADIARACKADVDIVLVHHADKYADFGYIAGLEAAQFEAEEKYVAEMAGELSRNGGVPATHAVVRADVVSGIVARAHDIGADLIVMTSHGRTGLSRAWLGSVADGVIRRSAIPVLMLRPTSEIAAWLAPPNPYRKILVPLDGSQEAAAVCDAATALARCSGARLMLLRIVPPVPLLTTDETIAAVYPTLIPDEVATAGIVEEARQKLDGIARTMVDRDGVEVDHHVLVASNVAQAVLDFASASSADAIAMSTHSRGPSRLLMGSIADKLLRGSHLPVLLLHRVSEKIP
jgi:nucleotide-binding universal stress UspA family protein